MKQLLFLLLFPCLALAQYQGNGNQKITLGEQTTADGLVYRGLAADTTRKPSVDTMAYILLDTNTNIIWQYKKAVNNAWTRVGGSISSGVTGVLPVANGGTGSATQNFVDLTTAQSINGVKTFLDTIIVNKGIRFPATQSASTNVNTLDDYEEGTWTPTIRGNTTAGTYTPSSSTAFYTKIGNVVNVWCFVDMRGGTATGGVGALILESLPFAYKAGSAFAGTTRFDVVDYPQDSSHGTFAARTTSGSASSILFQISRDNATTESISITGFTTSSLLTTNFSYTTN